MALEPGPPAKKEMPNNSQICTSEGGLPVEGAEGAGKDQAGGRASWRPATPALGTKGHQGGRPPPHAPEDLEPGGQSHTT